MDDFRDSIDQIKRLIKPSTILGRYQKLKRISPQSLKCLCPFHSEKTPSLIVHDDKGFVHCFGCGYSGDVVSLHKDLENIDFSEAVRQLKVEAGLEDVYLTKAQRKYAEIEKQKRLRLLKEFRAWKNGLRDDLIRYTNTQWRMYRIARRQSMDNSTEELEQQIQQHYDEAVRREAALDEFDSMGDGQLLEWYQTRKTWLGVRNPPWVLSGWRLDMAKAASV